MIKPFNIVRDLENKTYTKGSDSIVLTQFDTGIYIDFYVLLSGKTIQWEDGVHSVKVTFKNGNNVIIERLPCVLKLDEGKWSYEITHALTNTAGNVMGIIDVEKGGVRVASSQFSVLILEHLARG